MSLGNPQTQWMYLLGQSSVHGHVGILQQAMVNSYLCSDAEPEFTSLADVHIQKKAHLPVLPGCWHQIITGISFMFIVTWDHHHQSIGL